MSAEVLDEDERRYEEEVQDLFNREVLLVVGDLKFTHSIAKAVAVAIEESRVEETQSVHDQDFTLTLNDGENCAKKRGQSIYSLGFSRFRHHVKAP